MELYQLKTFVKVADEGNLTRASEALFTSQPAISGQIKALEEGLGIQLFIRSSKGMLLTPAGRKLYQQARVTLDAAEQMKRQAQSLQNELVGELRIGMHTDYDFLRLGELYHSISRQYPALVSHFLQSSSATVIRELRNDQLDAGFMFGPCRADDMVHYPLANVEMRVIGPSDWADRIHGKSLSELARRPWVYTTPNCPFFLLFEQLFDTGEQPPSEIVWCDNEDAIRALIRANAGLSLVKAADAKRASNEGYGVVWEGQVPEISMNLVLHKQRQYEPALAALIETTRKLWQQEPVPEAAGDALIT